MESERILGQNHILRHFENAIRMGKISHAYIINGEEGSCNSFCQGFAV